MAATLQELPSIDALLAFEPEDLAPLVLRTAVDGGQLHRQSVSYYLFEGHNPELQRRFPSGRRREVELAIGEAWNWLQATGILVPDVGTNGQNGWMVLSRRGRRVLEQPGAFTQFRQASAFPKSMLHPSIADRVWIELARGDLDDAVFKAFKAVEEEVRAAAGYGNTDIGVAMMRKAFDPEAGPLTDKEQPKGEREALMHLFAGAIGSYKNPHSHRTVRLTDPGEAQEMVVLASHLLRIVDARRKRP